MAKILGIFIAVILGLAVVAFSINWMMAPLGVTSVQNVRQQFGFAYTMSNSLRASARQACTLEKLAKRATTDEERMQRESQLAAVEMNYERIAQNYDSRMQNAFQAKYVAPSDVPREAPTLEQMKLDACN